MRSKVLTDRARMCIQRAVRDRLPIDVNGAYIERLEARQLLTSVVVNTAIDAVYPPSSGLISLRNAVLTANASTSPTTITFDSKVFASQQTIVLNANDLELTNIDEPTTITGPEAGLVISGNKSSKVFQVDPDVTTFLSGIVVTNALSGGIEIFGTATLTSMTVTDTVSVPHSDVGYGGIYIAQYANATLNDVTVSNNTSNGDGGGIDNSGTATLQNVTVSGNTASLNGGGIYNEGTIGITDATVSENTGGWSWGGGGICNQGVATLTNITVSGNTSVNGAGGGGICNTATATLNNSTIFGNSASGSGANAGYDAESQGGGIYTVGLPEPATTNIANTIVADNADSSGADVYGHFNSYGGNLVGATDDSTGFNAADLAGTSAKPLNAKLGVLANNGGFSETMLPLAGSPAIGAGLVAFIPKGITTDQRGFPRIVNGKVDIGAAEVQPSVITSIVVSAPASQSATDNITKSFTLGSFSESNATSPYTVTVNWGDGSTNGTINLTAAGTIPATAHTFTTSGSKTVAITIKDSAGHTSNNATFVVTVALPVVTVTLTPPSAQTAVAGKSQNFTLGSFTESNATAPYTVTINWGDGSSSTNVSVANAGSIPATSHTYATSGNKTVSLAVKDSAGHNSNSSTFAVVVSPAASITLTAPSSQTATAGQSKAFNLGTFAQSYASAPFTVSIIWGDGTTTSSLSVKAAGSIPASSHNFTVSGTKSVSVTVKDSAGHVSNSATFSVLVSPAAATKLVFGEQPTNGSTGAILSPPFIVDVEDPFGNIVISNTSTVTLAMSSHPTGSILTGTTAVKCVNGVAMFSSESLNLAGSYTFKVSDGSLTSVVSSSIAIAKADPATKLAFEQIPSTGTTGVILSPTIEVKVEDLSGNIVTPDSSTVTLSLASFPSGGALGGTTTVKVVNGIATFTGITLGVAGSYTFKATDGSLTSVTSSTVSISPNIAKVTVNEPGQYEPFVVGQAAYYDANGPSNFWHTIPADLLADNLSFYHIAPNPANTSSVQYGLINFTVLTSGPVWMLTTTRYGGGGNSSGGWTSQVSTPAQLEAEGWTQEETMIYDESGYGAAGTNPVGLEYVLWVKNCTAGETFSIRTEKYAPPIILQ